MDHLKKIGEGLRLPNKAQLNDDGVEYSIAQTKNLYLDLTLEDEVSKLLKVLGIDSEVFFKQIKLQKIKDNLKESTNDAFKKNVFGAPTFTVNEKIFWGQDRLEYALEELS